MPPLWTLGLFIEQALRLRRQRCSSERSGAQYSRSCCRSRSSCFSFPSSAAARSRSPATGTAHCRLRRRLRGRARRSRGSGSRGCRSSRLEWTLTDRLSGSWGQPDPTTTLPLELLRVGGDVDELVRVSLDAEIEAPPLIDPRLPEARASSYFLASSSSLSPRGGNGLPLLPT